MICAMTAEAEYKNPRNDVRPVEELVRVALTEIDEEAAWEPVAVLHFRGNREVLEVASDLCGSPVSKERRLGAAILGQLGVPDRTFPSESFDILSELLEKETDPDVLSSIGVALGHLKDPRAIERMVKFKNHASADVRFGVVLGISGYEDDLASRTLIELSRDEDEEVRDWATFGLGTLTNSDTTEMRDALFARLSDSHDNTRGEALFGLAKRHDSRVIEPLLKQLSLRNVGRLLLEAAEAIGDSRLYPALSSLKPSEYDGSDAVLLADALAKCRPQ